MAAMLLTACANDEDVTLTEQSGIVFGIGVDTIERSRGESSPADRHFRLAGGSDTVAVACKVEDMACPQAISRSTPSETVTSFHAWSYLHEGSAKRIFFTNEPVSDKGSYWATDRTYYWPTSQSQQLSFIALAGTPDIGLETDLSGADFALHYTVPAKAAAQTDVMLAETDPVNGSGMANYCVPIDFKHICSAVRFKTGSPLQPGSIEKITLSGIMSEGTFTKGQWTDLNSPRSFSIDTPVQTTGNETQGKDLYLSYETFMFLPQNLGEDARLEVEFRDDITGQIRTLSASLAGHELPIGKITTFLIGITPGFNLEFTTEPPVQDAHYVMCNTEIRVAGVSENAPWTLTATASDGADVTIQRESDVNEYAKQGFWLDKTMTNGVIQNVSARGTSSITGNGSVDQLSVRVFIPENVSESQREITLRLEVEGAPASTAVTQTISQLNPAWNGSTGWEQIYGDEQGIFGFCYSARHVYVYNNSEEYFTANRIIGVVENLISQYNASGFASVARFRLSAARYRNYVDIDYRKLNTLGSSSSSVSDGIANTKELFSFGGTAISNNFENALLDMRRVNNQSAVAYRKRAADDPGDVPQCIDGEAIGDSQTLALVLKKNRYYLNTMTSTEDLSTTAPLIRVDDIVWYLPAYGQFADAPDWTQSTIAEYWSSTAASGSDAYTGDGNAALRTATKKIRVARNR